MHRLCVYAQCALHTVLSETQSLNGVQAEYTLTIRTQWLMHWTTIVFQRSFCFLFKIADYNHRTFSLLEGVF